MNRYILHIKKRAVDTYGLLRIVRSYFIKRGQQSYVDVVESDLPTSLCISTVAAVFKILFNFCCILAYLPLLAYWLEFQSVEQHPFD
jgi:hypothetical protein